MIYKVPTKQRYTAVNCKIIDKEQSALMINNAQNVVREMILCDVKMRNADRCTESTPTSNSGMILA